MSTIRFFVCTLIFSYTVALAATPAILLERQQAAALFQQKDWLKAESAYLALSQKSPNDGAIWHNLGAGQIRLHKYIDAQAAFEQSLKTGRRPHECYYNIACAQALNGEKAPALLSLTKAFAAGYVVAAEEIQADSDLSSLHSDISFRTLIGWPDSGLANREKRWQQDIAFLEKRIREIHWRPFGVISESKFNDKVAAFRRSITTLNDLQLRLKMQELMASLGDGHSMVSPDLFLAMHGAGHGQESGNSFKLLPLEFFLFGTEVRIVATEFRQKEVLGARVIAVGGRPIDSVLRQIEPLVSKDNEWGGRWTQMVQLCDPRILQGLGIGDTINGIRISCETLNSPTIREFTIPVTTAISPKFRLENHSVLSRTSTLDQTRKLEMMSIDNALYVKIEQMADEHGESFANFVTRIFSTATETKATALILDLRRNNGGQGQLSRDLFHRLIASEQFNQPGSLYVMVGRNTFSAAMVFTAQLKLHTSALLVGEPTGSKPNFVGESTVIRLPYSRINISISSRYHQNGESNDTRNWLPPDVPVVPDFNEMRRGYDRALETILELVDG